MAFLDPPPATRSQADWCPAFSSGETVSITTFLGDFSDPATTGWLSAQLGIVREE
jgi:hypothetical protein